MTKFSLTRDTLAKLPFKDVWFTVPPERRGKQTHPRIGTLDMRRYGKALLAARNAVQVAQTIQELARLPIGMLSLQS